MVENKYLVNKQNFISILCYIPFVGNDRGQTFSVSLHKVFTTLLLVFWPIPPCRSPLEQWCFGAARWATWTFNSLQRFSMGLRSGDWLGHSRTLKCFLRSHSFVARWCVWDHCHAEKTQPCFIFTLPLLMLGGFTQNLTIHGPIHSVLYTDQSSWSLCRKTSHKAGCFHPHASQ